MLPGVCEAAGLFLMVCLVPVESAAGCADGEGSLKKDQDIGPGDSLPHGWHIGMFLRDVATGIAILFEPRDQCGLARATGTNDADKRRCTADEGSLTWRLHKKYVVTTSLAPCGLPWHRPPGQVSRMIC